MPFEHAPIIYTPNAARFVRQERYELSNSEWATVRPHNSRLLNRVQGGHQSAMVLTMTAFRAWRAWTEPCPRSPLSRLTLAD